MLTKKIKAAALCLGLLALSMSADVFAGCGNIRHHGGKVEAAQANYQDETALIPVAGSPIPFTVRNFRTNFDVNSERTVFEVEVPGLYSLDAFLIVNVPTVGNSVAGYITINDRQLLTFYERETSTTSTTVNFHFNDRLVYLNKGDKVSVVLTEFVAGTTVSSRGIVLIALNNTH